MLDLRDIDVLTFDCYGTLIDWETGILDAVGPLLASRGLDVSPGRVLRLYAAGEAQAEAEGWQPYRDVLAQTLASVLAGYGSTPEPHEASAFADSLPHWRPFEDTLVALDRLRRHVRIGVISNIDDDLFAQTRRHLGERIDFVVTAQQAGAYKPDAAPFLQARELLGALAARHAHVGQSRFHDVAPARRLGIPSVLVKRQGDGATPPDGAEPDLRVPDLAALADAMDAAKDAAPGPSVPGC